MRAPSLPLSASAIDAHDWSSAHRHEAHIQSRAAPLQATADNGGNPSLRKSTAADCARAGRCAAATHRQGCEDGEACCENILKISGSRLRLLDESENGE